MGASVVSQDGANANVIALEMERLRVNGWNNVVVLDKREMVANYERLIFELIEEKY